MPAEPPAPDRVSLRDIATSTGRSLITVRVHWATKEDFPAARGQGPAGENLYEAADWAAWWDRHPELHSPAFTPPDPERRVTLTTFAELVGRDPRTITQYKDTEGFPSPGPDGTYRLGNLAVWWNNRPGHGRYERQPTTGGRADQVADMLRTSIAAGQLLQPDEVAAELGISLRVARGHLTAAARRVVPELGLVSRADIAARLRNATPRARANRVADLMNRPGAPVAVASVGRTLYYRMDNVVAFLRDVVG